MHPYRHITPFITPRDRRTTHRACCKGPLTASSSRSVLLLLSTCSTLAMLSDQSPISTFGPAIPNASCHSVPSPARINKHPRLASALSACPLSAPPCHLSLLQRSTARPFTCALERREDNVTVPDRGSAAPQGTTYLPQPNRTAPQLETISSPLPLTYRWLRLLLIAAPRRVVSALFCLPPRGSPGD
jgi:hypothetical protein